MYIDIDLLILIFIITFFFKKKYINNKNEIAINEKFFFAKKNFSFIAKVFM